MPPTENPTELLWSPATYPVWAAIFFLFGLIFGSFFNVAIYRWPMGMSTNRPSRSFCFRCGSQIRWYDNIPVISWLLLGGRCRDCGSPISPRYALVELLTGVLFLVVFITTNAPEAPAFRIATLWYLAFAGMLVIGTFTDLDHWIIPDRITIGGSIVGILAAIPIAIIDGQGVLAASGPFPAIRHAWGGDFLTFIEALFREDYVISGTPLFWWEPIANSLLGAVFGPLLLYSIGLMGKVLLRRDAMGFGDVKLFVMVGATLGPINVLLVVMLASLFGSVVGIAAIISSYAAKRSGPPALQHGLSAIAAPEAAPPAAEDTPSPVGEESALLRRFASKAGQTPSGTPVHHLPFGPSIALASLTLLLLHEQAWRFLENAFFPY